MTGLERTRTKRAVLIRWACALIALIAPVTCSGVASEADAPPDLVVLVVVDQLTPALVEHYAPVFSGGIRTLIDRGVWLDAIHDYAGTSTGPGHGTLATGVVPARHGAVGNSWREERDGEWVEVGVVVDPGEAIPGFEPGDGRSPRNLVREGFADWLVAASPSSRVVSISGKDRGAILPAGQVRGDVLWFETRAGRFLTSSYYRDEQASWVERFNDDALPAYFRDGCWNGEVPDSVAHLSRADTFPFENDGVRVHFPHCFDEEHHRDNFLWFSRTPFLDEATGALAASAVRELELGRRGAIDFLSVGFSATDRIGHRWGPWSREQLDNLIRLDRTLGDFFAMLDEEVGEGRYVVALSADHGVAPLPEHEVDGQESGRRVRELLRDDLRRLAPRSDARSSAAAGTPDAVIAELEALEYIEQVIPYEALVSREAADSFTVLFRNSYYPGRRSARMAEHDFDLRLTEGSTVRATGTGHGTPYLHDRLIPLAFLGVDDEALEQLRRVDIARSVDVAPTLAAIARIPAPGDLDGRSLLDLPSAHSSPGAR